MVARSLNWKRPVMGRTHHTRHKSPHTQKQKKTYRSHDGADDDRDDPAEVHGQPGEQRHDQRQQEELSRAKTIKNAKAQQHKQARTYNKQREKKAANTEQRAQGRTWNKLLRGKKNKNSMSEFRSHTNTDNRPKTTSRFIGIYILWS